MMKLYFKEIPSTKKMEEPRPELIQYLLNYSKQLRVVKTNKNYNIELHLN
ncbi:MAG TPA: hypothetical protein VJ970_07835 [Flavobacteriaceae bacterium]|nr:hypothetical protein [Flavobacteriaceae bacterium]